jgi:hypothetical protein
MAAFPSITAVTYDATSASDPLPGPTFDAATYTGGTTNTLQATGGQVTKTQPSGTGFGSQTAATVFGPAMENWCRIPVKASDGQEMLALFLRLQTIGASTTKGYAVVVNAAAGTDSWDTYRLTGAAFSSGQAPATQEISAGDYVGAKVEDSGGNPVITAFYCPTANNPTLTASWTQISTWTDTDAVNKVTGTGKVGWEIQGIVVRLDDLRFGTITPTVDRTGRMIVGP